MDRRTLAKAFAAMLAALCPSSCFYITRPTVGVKDVGLSRVYEGLNANAINSDGLSAKTRETLHYFDLEELFAKDMDGAIRSLHEHVLLEPLSMFVFALAELSYHAGETLASRDHYLAAAIYAHHYLLGKESRRPPSAFDRSFRWACDIYNAGVQRAFVSPDGRELVPEDATRTLPVGDVRITLDRSSLPWSEEECSTFVRTDRFDIFGLSIRLRRSGLGVPLIGEIERDVAEDTTSSLRTGTAGVPVTAFLRVEGTLADLDSGTQACLELYSAFDTPVVSVHDETVPLESDFSTPLAYGLDRSSLWQSSLTGFFRDDSAQGLHTGAYEPGRVPVVFIHGTLSNPAHWAEMFNTLYGDSDIRERMQFWFFQYATGNPIGYSGAKLREALAEAVRTFDPDGEDLALQRMVLIGHSQGGLLVKLAVVDGQLEWFEELVERPVKDLDLSPQEMDLLIRVLDFDPQPSVERVVFIATPHRGSYFAANWWARFAGKLIALPGELQDLGDQLFSDEASLPPQLRGKRIGTSLDSMNPSNEFLQLLETQSVALGVRAHSIIAIGGADPSDEEEVEDSRDGVVEYISAHIEPVESEFLVRSGHSCQGHPDTIREVRRILREHLEVEKVGEVSSDP